METIYIPLPIDERRENVIGVLAELEELFGPEHVRTRDVLAVEIDGDPNASLIVRTLASSLAGTGAAVIHERAVQRLAGTLQAFVPPEEPANPVPADPGEWTETGAPDSSLQHTRVEPVLDVQYAAEPVADRPAEPAVCKLEGCGEPATTPSGYCSRSHAQKGSKARRRSPDFVGPGGKHYKSDQLRNMVRKGRFDFGTRFRNQHNGKLYTVQAGAGYKMDLVEITGAAG